jgi:hypothetical protein
MSLSGAQILEISNVLSRPRFSTYLQECNNNTNNALKLYQWNLEVSTAFILPLHILEISLRNAVVDVLEIIHTSNWPWQNGFIRSLPNGQPNSYSPKRDLCNVASSVKPRTTGKVVAELKFIFWEKMFTSRYDQVIWENHIKSVFPNACSSLTYQELRKKIYQEINIIRKLRNRIAHHEPIFSRNLQDDYNNISYIIRCRSLATESWMQNMEEVTKILDQRPRV